MATLTEIRNIRPPESMSYFVAQRLFSAASRLIGTCYLPGERSIEMSLDAADTSVCATMLAQAFSMRSEGLNIEHDIAVEARKWLGERS